MATNAGMTVWVSPTPSPDPMDLDAFELVNDWVQVSFVGNVDQSGEETNFISYPTMDTDVVQQDKGTTTGGSPSIECRSDDDDPGQILMREIGTTKFTYPFKFQWDNPKTVGGEGTIEYNWAKVGESTSPNGGVEDYKIDVFPLVCNQRRITVAAT